MKRILFIVALFTFVLSGQAYASDFSKVPDPDGERMETIHAALSSDHDSQTKDELHYESIANKKVKKIRVRMTIPGFKNSAYWGNVKKDCHSFLDKDNEMIINDGKKYPVENGRISTLHGFSCKKEIKSGGEIIYEMEILKDVDLRFRDLKDTRLVFQISRFSFNCPWYKTKCTIASRLIIKGIALRAILKNDEVVRYYYNPCFYQEIYQKKKMPTGSMQEAYDDPTIAVFIGGPKETHACLITKVGDSEAAGTTNPLFVKFRKDKSKELPGTLPQTTMDEIQEYQNGSGGSWFGGNTNGFKHSFMPHFQYLGNNHLKMILDWDDNIKINGKTSNGMKDEDFESGDVQIYGARIDGVFAIKKEFDGPDDPNGQIDYTLNIGGKGSNTVNLEGWRMWVYDPWDPNFTQSKRCYSAREESQNLTLNSQFEPESETMTLEYGSCSELNSVEVFNMDNLLDFIYFD